jgi:hypothetical protein
MFDVSIKVVAGNQRGVLAKVAAAISEHGSNIGNVAMEEEDGSPYTVLFFTAGGEPHAPRACDARSACCQTWCGSFRIKAQGRPCRKPNKPFHYPNPDFSMNEHHPDCRRAGRDRHLFAGRAGRPHRSCRQIGLTCSMQLVDGVDAQIHRVFKTFRSRHRSGRLARRRGEAQRVPHRSRPLQVNEIMAGYSASPTRRAQRSASPLPRGAGRGRRRDGNSGNRPIESGVAVFPSGQLWRSPPNSPNWA